MPCQHDSNTAQPHRYRIRSDSMIKADPVLPPLTPQRLKFFQILKDIHEFDLNFCTEYKISKCTSEF